MAFAVPLLAAGIGGLAAAAGNKFFSGSPEKRENVGVLRKEQEPLYQQAVNAGLRPGAGGAFGQSADYYRGLLGDNSKDFEAFAAPQMRQYREEIMPGISEQFAGMGSGGLSSSGFMNAQKQGGVDLAERLGAIRASLRQAGAQGLQNIAQTGLGNYSQNMTTQPGTSGFLSSIAPALGSAATSYGADWLKNSFGQNKTGPNTSPYGSGGPQASPKLPGFLENQGVRGY